jgi:hypothetical protein
MVDAIIGRPRSGFAKKLVRHFTPSSGPSSSHAGMSAITLWSWKRSVRRSGMIASPREKAMCA